MAAKAICLSPQVSVFTETLDVRDAAKIESLPARLSPEFAEVDILVNNAGLALGTAPVTEISTEVSSALYSHISLSDHKPYGVSGYRTAAA